MNSNNMYTRVLQVLAVALVLSCAIVCFAFKPLISSNHHMKQNRPRRTVEQAVAVIGEDARARMAPYFAKANVSYPPKSIILLGLKSEKILQLYAQDSNGGGNQLIHAYPILGTSGHIGPKLKEGDKQMPEGVYRIREFEPNSSYHIALRVDYPSPFDKERGAEDGREKLGSDIMIHGKDQSVGCLAMGDPASEELFVLVQDVGLANTELLMCPYDFRTPPPGVALPKSPLWINEVYANLKSKVLDLPLDLPKD